MVGVAQLVELRIVIPVVAGSIPVAHPIYWDQIGVEQAALGWCAWAILASSIQHPASSIQHSAFTSLLTEHWLRCLSRSAYSAGPALTTPTLTTPTISFLAACKIGPG